MFGFFVLLSLLIQATAGAFLNALEIDSQRVGNQFSTRWKSVWNVSVRAAGGGAGGGSDGAEWGEGDGGARGV